MPQRQVYVKKYCSFDVTGWHEIPSLHIWLLHDFAFPKAGMSLPCFIFNLWGGRGKTNADLA